MPLGLHHSHPAADNYCHIGWQSLKTKPVLPTHMHVTEQDMLWRRTVLHRMVYEQGCSMLTYFKTMRK
jgi:hypothetical protein